MSKFASAVLALGLSLIGAQSALAALVTTDPGTGVTTTFTATGNNGFGNPGPVVLDGITWTGAPQATYGNANYGLLGNGNWNWSWVATNNGSGSITASLGGAYGLVGGFMNYAPNSGSAPTIEALAADGVTVLESYDLSVLAPITTSGTNQGAFRGISRVQDDIYFLRLSGSYIITHTLEVGNPGGTVPEPVSLALVGLGLLAAGAARRRKA